MSAGSCGDAVQILIFATTYLYCWLQGFCSAKQLFARLLIYSYLRRTDTDFDNLQRADVGFDNLLTLTLKSDSYSTNPGFQLNADSTFGSL